MILVVYCNTDRQTNRNHKNFSALLEIEKIRKLSSLKFYTKVDLNKIYVKLRFSLSTLFLVNFKFHYLNTSLTFYLIYRSNFVKVPSLILSVIIIIIIIFILWNNRFNINNLSIKWLLSIFFSCRNWMKP